MAKGKFTGGRQFDGSRPGPGRPKTPPEVKEGRKLTRELFESIVYKYTGFSKDELIAVIKDPKTPVLEIIVAMILKEAMVRGDQVRMNFILDRLLGKVKEEVRHSGDAEQPLTVVIKDYLSND